MQLSRYFWMVLVAALVAATPLQAGIVLEDDFEDGIFDSSKWSKMLGNGATIVEEDGVMKLREGVTGSDYAYLVTVEEWIPAPGAEMTVSGTITAHNHGSFTIWLRATDYVETVWNPGTAALGLRLANWPLAYGSYLNVNGLEKSVIGEEWHEFSGGGTGANLPTPKPDPPPVSWDFLLTDDGTNVVFTVTEAGTPTNTATFTGVSTFSADDFHVLFVGKEVDLEDVTISVGGGGEPIPGDANDNGIVNDEDASILAAHWQMTGMTWGDGDFNDDQIVNDADASILAANWQSTGEEGAPVPEPAMLVLLAGGLVTLLLWRRK